MFRIQRIDHKSEYNIYIGRQIGSSVLCYAHTHINAGAQISRKFLLYNVCVCVYDEFDPCFYGFALYICLKNMQNDF